jgi:phage terminase large subunit-like protein
MCTWVPGVTQKSPDRMDALVWLVFALVIEPEEQRFVATHDDRYVISPY